jgi:hypothetical protein
MSAVSRVAESSAASETFMTFDTAGIMVFRSQPSGIVTVMTMPFPATSASITSFHDAERSKMYVPALMLRSFPVSFA